VPFVHLDNDVFLWNPLPDRILKARLCFQSHEPFDKPGYHYYNLLKKPWVVAPVRPQKIVDNEVMDFAYNCGICGGNDLKFFKEWMECSKEYIFAPANQDVFFKQFANVLIHQNLFHEQYFAASLIKMHSMRRSVRVMANDAMKINAGLDPKKPRYTHLWGTTKKDKYMMAKVRISIMKMNPQLFISINDFCEKHNI
jgi:hypothetical protein